MSARGRRQIKRIMRDLSGHASKDLKKFVINTHHEITDTTPVDKGWARGNWQVTTGSPATGVIGSPDSVGDAGDVLSALAGQNLLDKRTYIVNNVPYIRALNAGHSKQAPKQFVEKALIKVLQRL